MVSLPFLVLALVLCMAPAASAETGWWTPTARPTPDSQINVFGEPFTGTDSQGRVRGFVDAHNHIMSNEAFGGGLLCGKPFSEQGITDALADCPEHDPGGNLAAFDWITTGDGRHDPVGWPTFRDWPAHDSRTHQQNYYAWIERAWRGGQRVLVNDFVTNGVLCTVNVFKDRDCDEMASVRLQAQKTYAMQAYVDSIYGGPGNGFFRIVTDSAQARNVIEQGKLAVVLGVEISEPFGCKQIRDVPQCNRDDIDRGLDELYGLGVRSMFLCHKFDNALCGVRLDEGSIGTAVNVGQFLSTATFWQTEPCPGPQRDNPIGLAPAAEAEKLLPPDVSVPVYNSAAQCNTRGLTELGEYAMRGMIARGMMSRDRPHERQGRRPGPRHPAIAVVSRRAVLAQLDGPELERTGLSPRRIHRRIHAPFRRIRPRGRGDDGTARQVWHRIRRRHRHERVRWLARTQGAATPNPVRYPFISVDGESIINRQITGERTWDINTDGAAHYGLLPDWIEDLRLHGGQGLVDDLMSGAESYLNTWKGAEDHSPA